MYPLMERWGVSSHYGPRPALGDFHYGIDFPCPVGTPIPSIIDGVMKLSGFYKVGVNRANVPLYEGIVTVEAHDKSENWTVGHCSKVNQAVSAIVKRGQIIGLAGNTGNSTGPHAHIELCEGRFNGSITANHESGKMQNPYERLRAWSASATGPGKDEVTWNDFVRTMYRLFRPGDALTDEIVSNHTGNLASLDSKGVDDWIRSFIASGDQYVTPRKVLATYWAAKGGAEPDKYADERLGGGATIASVLNGDLPADARALKEAKEQKEATDAALTDATNYGRKLDAKIIAQEDEIRDLHIELERTETPPADVSLNGLRLLGNYLTKLVKKEQKGGGNS